MDMPNLDKNITCCFAGYRPHKFTYPVKQKDAFFEKLKEDITDAIRKSYLEGYRNFLCGGAMGFDLMCGECVIELKKEYPDIKLGCILPFEKYYKNFPYKWKKTYKNVLENCDFINYITIEYVESCFFERSQKIINSSKRLITYFTGKRGGTAKFVSYAQLNKLEIINLSKENSISEDTTFFTGKPKSNESFTLLEENDLNIDN